MSYILVGQGRVISIHALRGEGDAIIAAAVSVSSYFNPRPPWGGRLPLSVPKGISILISIHALRGEGDPHSMPQSQLHTDFNPRPPWGGRRSLFRIITRPRSFQSTPSVGRATTSSIPTNLGTLFQSTPSVGRATGWDTHGLPVEIISIHALRGEGDTIYYIVANEDFISIHALRGEGDCKNIQICNAMLVHSAYKTIYFCDSCAFYLT